MSNITSDIKLVNSWKLSKLPTDLVLLEDNKKWAVLGSSDKYWEVSAGNDKAEKKPTATELYKAEKTEKGFVIVTYNATTRVNEAWVASSLDMKEKEALEIEDAANIAYSPAQQKAYWITQSRKLMLYDFATKTSESTLENYSVSEFCMSENGNYMALLDTDNNIFLVEVKSGKIAAEKKSEAGQHYRIAGATDKGELVLYKLNVAKKGGKRPKNQVVLIRGDKTVHLLEDVLSWAYVYGNDLATWGNDKLSIYDLSNL